MTLTMYCIKDELNEFTPPIPFLSEEIAKRYLKDQVIENPTVRNSKKDFSMWKVGTFETKTGTMIGYEPVLLERAENYGE